MVLEIVFKVDKREPKGGGTIFVRQKWSPPPPPPPPPPPQAGREGTGGREAKDYLETEGEGGPYLSDKSRPPSKEYRHLEIVSGGLARL